MIKLILGIVVLFVLWQQYQLYNLRTAVANAQTTLLIQQGKIYTLESQLINSKRPAVKTIVAEPSSLSGFAETSDYIVKTISKNVY